MTLRDDEPIGYIFQRLAISDYKAAITNI